MREGKKGDIFTFLCYFQVTKPSIRRRRRREEAEKE
jgi:hypothetical protein